MFSLVRLSIKNIFRNKRRSLISGIAIIFGIVILIFATSYVEGLYNGMTNTVIKSGIGHLQIHKKGYIQAMEDKTTSNNYYFDEDKVENIIKDTLKDDVKYVNNHIVYTALIGNDNNSTSAFIQGIYPSKEKNLYNNIILKEGEKLRSNDKEKILINERIKRVFKLNVGDKINLFVNGKDRKSKTFEVAGVFDTDVQFGSFNSRTEVYLNLNECKELLDINNEISEIVIELNNSKDVSRDKKSLVNAFNENNLDLEVHDYKYLGSTLLDIASYIKIGIRAWTVVLFIVILFMILNTFTMSVYERTYEIGILKAIGMKKRKIRGLFILESAFLSVIANIFGVLIATILIKIFNIIGFPGMFGFILKGESVHPVINVVDTIYIVVISILISIIASIYPSNKASKMNPIDAIRSE